MLPMKHHLVNHNSAATECSCWRLCYENYMSQTPKVWAAINLFFRANLKACVTNILLWIIKCTILLDNSTHLSTVNQLIMSAKDRPSKYLCVITMYSTRLQRSSSRLAAATLNADWLRLLNPQFCTRSIQFIPFPLHTISSMELIFNTYIFCDLGKESNPFTVLLYTILYYYHALLNKHDSLVSTSQDIM